MTVQRKRKVVPSTFKSDPLLSSLRPFIPQTENQELMLSEYIDNKKNILAIGSAGTGKTYTALALALKDICEGRKNRVIIIRSAVPVRDIGFLPGTEEEKMAAYEAGYISIVNNLFKRDDAYGILKQKRLIQFESSSYLRGVTFKDSAIVVDEVENFTYSEMNTVMTRVGVNTQVSLCGDILQTDLNPKDSGFKLLEQVIPNMPSDFAKITFGHDDIVRSGFCKAWIIAVEKYTDFYKRF